MKYGIKVDFDGTKLWILNIPPGVHFENPSPVLFDNPREADQWAHDSGWKNYEVKEYTAK